MKRKLFIFKIVCVVGICFLAYPSLAIMKVISTEELTTESELIIMGDVEDITAQWSPDGQTIFTRVTVGNVDVIKGETGQEKVVVEHAGGEVGHTGYRVSDTASFRKEQRVMLFLKYSQSKYAEDAYRIVGKAQGKYTISDNGIARKEGFYAIGERGVIDNNIPVGELVDKIRRVK